MMDGQEPNLDQLLRAREEIDSALRKHKAAVTVLFTDLVGSTAYFDRYGDTAGVALLHRHGELASAAVEEFRGTVIKTLGDSVMALFPAPAHAVRAAVEIQRRLLTLNDTQPGRDRLQLRIGIHHGSAFQSGADVYGDAVNVAARITKRTGPAQILISRSVREAISLESDLRCSWLGKVTIQGKSEKEEIYEVIWTDPATYANLQTGLKNSLLRGELTAQGLRGGDLIQPEESPEALHDESVTLTAAESPGRAGFGDRFEILTELGQGGMGVVYKARDRETGAVLALKALKPEIAARADVLERFKNELLLARKITHKNVCRTYDLHRFGDTTAITMEFVEGESLRSLLRRVEGLSLRHGMRVARQILAEMAEAHAQGVVHRDLKPENIMITPDGTVKIMDFGIARAAEAGATTTGGLIGTPAYMSPEQAEGKPIDARTDIYSLGLVFYEMFTGDVPFKAETPVAIVHKQIHEPPPSPSHATPIFPVHLERILLRCLEKDPRKRYQTVTELDSALTHREQAAPEKAASAEPGALPEPEPDPRLLVWSRLDSMLLAAGVLGLICFLALRDTVLPASNWKLKLDALSARRQAEELGRRLGRPFPENSSAELDFRDEVYYLSAESSIGRRYVPAWRSLWPFKLPVYWRVRFQGEQDHLLSAIGSIPERLVVLDQNGNAVHFSHAIAGGISGDYRPPPVDQRRQAARQAATQVCGPLPDGIVFAEEPGSASGYFFTTTGRVVSENRLVRSVRIVLAGETPVEIECAREAKEDSSPRTSLFELIAHAAPGLHRWLPVGMLVLLSCGLITIFVLERCHRLPGAWKRAPLAILLGAGGTWLVRLRFFELPEVLWPLILVAFAGLVWIGLVSGEHLVRRREPARIASYAKLWQGSFNHPAVNLALVRGALLGLIVVGSETLLAYSSLAILKAFALPELARVFVAFVLIPFSVAEAAESSWPSLYVSWWALFAGVAGSLVLLALPWTYSDWMTRVRIARRFRPPWEEKLDRLALPLIVFSVTIGLPSPLFKYATLYYLIGTLCLSLLFAWLVACYDVLTVASMIGTIIVLSLAYPLLAVFTEVGNGGLWAMLVVWGAIVLLAGLFVKPTAVERWSRGPAS